MTLEERQRTVGLTMVKTIIPYTDTSIKDKKRIAARVAFNHQSTTTAVKR